MGLEPPTSALRVHRLNDCGRIDYFPVGGHFLGNVLCTITLTLSRSTTAIAVLKKVDKSTHYCYSSANKSYVFFFPQSTEVIFIRRWVNSNFWKLSDNGL
uniref:Uncharacterized protein n=1 Tax=Cacopsylla melanoneura TaxID=428564 RepID=A0A8D8XYA0_9HEMI